MENYEIVELVKTFVSELMDRDRTIDYLRKLNKEYEEAVAFWKNKYKAVKEDKEDA